MNRFRNDWNGLRWAIAALAAVACAAPSAHAQCNYEVTAIIQAPPCPFVGPPVTRGADLNSMGWVCGHYDQCSVSANEAFYWTPETGFHTIPRPSGMTTSFATGINDHGIVCGYGWFTGVGDRAWVYDTATGEFTYMPTLHGVGNSYANAINNSNVVVGSRSIGTTGANPFNAVIWKPFEKGAPVQDLGVMNGPNSSANAISETGVVVGWTGQSSTPQGFIYTGDVTILDRKSGATTSNLFVATNVGLIGGAGKFGSTLTKAFIWENHEITSIIEPLPGYTMSGITDANDLGQAVLRSTPGDAVGLWQHGKHLAVNDLVVQNPGVQLSWARAINNSGQILTRGLYQGKNVAVVLTPVGSHVTDINLDCQTDIHDLLILLGQWGPTPTNATGGVPIADFNQDGRVDVLDLLILLGNWG